MIVRYRYIIRKPDGTEYDGRYYSEAEAKYVYDRYDLQKQGFRIIKTYKAIKTKTDLINKILEERPELEVYRGRLHTMLRHKLVELINKLREKNKNE